jgi:hypothetical protein
VTEGGVFVFLFYGVAILIHFFAISRYQLKLTPIGMMSRVESELLSLIFAVGVHENIRAMFLTKMDTIMFHSSCCFGFDLCERQLSFFAITSPASEARKRVNRVLDVEARGRRI